MGGEDGGRRWDFDGEGLLGALLNQQPGNPQFPATWSIGLAKEGLRGKLGKWRNFGCGGFGIYGEELADSADERELPKP